MIFEIIECDVLLDVDYWIVCELYCKNVKLVIDDFGIGNSLFFWFEILCFDVLKIDKLFIVVIGFDVVNLMVIDIIIVLG